MTFDISKDFAFSAGHRLAGLPEGHPCARVHGHNWIVRVRLLAPRITDPGWVLDYGDLKPFGQYLDQAFDHQWLGTGTLTDEDGTKIPPVFSTDAPDVTGITANPTAENLAAWFRWWLGDPGNIPALDHRIGAMLRPVSVEVGVSETPKTWAWAR